MLTDEANSEVLIWFQLTYNSVLVHRDHLHGSCIASLQGIVALLPIRRGRKFHRDRTLVIRALFGHQRRVDFANQLGVECK